MVASFLEARRNFWNNKKNCKTAIPPEVIKMSDILTVILALNDGEYEVALKCANDANKAIDGHTKKTAHILTLQADSNSLHG